MFEEQHGDEKLQTDVHLRAYVDLGERADDRKEVRSEPHGMCLFSDRTDTHTAINSQRHPNPSTTAFAMMRLPNTISNWMLVTNSSSVGAVVGVCYVWLHVY